MLKIKIDASDPKMARICLFNDLHLVDYEVIPYSEDFEYSCHLAASALRERFESRNTPLWKRAQVGIAELEAELNATEFGQRGVS